MSREVFFKKSNKLDEDNRVYLYKGFYLKDKNNKKFYPISVVVSNKAINFLYTSYSKGKTLSIFKIDLLEGSINQKQTIKKIETYWHFSSIQLNTFEDKDIEKAYISPLLVKTGFFSDLFQFDIEIDKQRFQKYSYFDIGNKEDYRVEIVHNKREIRFYLKDKEIGRWWFEVEENDRKFLISTDKINFIHIFLDFLYEILYTKTFSDKGTKQYLEKIYDNPLFIALLAKFEYLDTLYKIRQEKIKTGDDLRKDFLEKEKNWANVLIDETFYPLFISSKSVFLNIEDEMSNLMFNTQIGKYKKSRVELLSKERMEDEFAAHFEKHYDQHLITEVSGFFLRRFNLKDAFRSIFPKFKGFTHWIMVIFFIISAFGDFLIYKFTGKYFYLNMSLPLLAISFMAIWYSMRKINLFKLFLPRLFLGILIGWLSFAMTADLWKDYLIKSCNKIIILDLALLIIIFSFIFTTIRNRLKRIRDKEVLKRSAFLVIFASSVSLFQGFYITQLEAKEILSVSDFFGKLVENSNEKKENTDGYVCEPIILDINDNKSIDKYCKPIKEVIKEGNFEISYIKTDSFTIYYLWKILASQFLVAILIGIVLQLLWEEKSITEPL